MSGIPLDSALARSMSPSRAHGWDYQHELLANAIELIDAGNRLFIQAHSKPGASKPPPIKINRPGTAPARRPATADDLRNLFQGGRIIGVPKEA